MSDDMTIDIDTAGLLSALTKLGPKADALVKSAAKVTGDRIAREARRRVARATGHTAEQIRVEETDDGKGYIVLANDPRDRKHIDKWLEFGTVHMTARPFLFASAQLEEGPHLKRVERAVQAAIDEVGLG